MTRWPAYVATAGACPRVTARSLSSTVVAGVRQGQGGVVEVAARGGHGGRHRDLAERRARCRVRARASAYTSGPCLAAAATSTSPHGRRQHLLAGDRALELEPATRGRRGAGRSPAGAAVWGSAARGRAVGRPASDGAAARGPPPASPPWARRCPASAGRVAVGQPAARRRARRGRPARSAGAAPAAIAEVEQRRESWPPVAERLRPAGRRRPARRPARAAPGGGSARPGRCRRSAAVLRGTQREEGAGATVGDRRRGPRRSPERVHAEPVDAGLARRPARSTRDAVGERWPGARGQLGDGVEGAGGGDPVADDSSAARVLSKARSAVVRDRVVADEGVHVDRRPGLVASRW